MKFSYGYWLNRPGTQVHGAAELRSFEIRGGRPTAYVSPFPVTHRGQTLGGPLLTLEFDSPAEGIIGVKTYHYKGDIPHKPAFELLGTPAPVSVEDAGPGGIRLCSGKMTVILTRSPFTMSFYYNGEFLTRSDTRQLAVIQTPEGPFIRERLDISIDECFYGLGERFTAFVKNGQSVDLWNEDGGTASELAYKNIPLCMSNRGYGVFVNHPEKVSFEIASESVSKNQFSVPGEMLHYYVIGGGSMRKALAAYTALTGKPALPPLWSFGLWLSTSFTTNYDEQTVTSFIDGMLERNIPLSVFHFDCFWMKEYEWCNFTWDTSQFPDIMGMLARIRAKGLRVCVWINPYIGQKSPLFDEAASAGYLLKKPGGGVWQWDMWQPGMALVDFTNPAAALWYQDKLSALLDMGVDCFKTDFGERIPVDVAYYDGSDPVKMHNYYTLLYNRAVYERLTAKRGPREAVVFARSATVGGQRYPVHWGGDSFATYASMAESLRGGLSLALSGFAFWSHDIGGFETTAAPDLYKRWVAFGLFSTHSRLHGSGSYRVPWLFDEEAVQVLRYFVEVKRSLMPYIFAQSVMSCAEGIPVMRPMVMAYPQDRVCAALDRQYMLGENLLVAPVFHEDGHCEFYLPSGRFTHLFSDRIYEGGRFYSESFGYCDMPVFVTENTLLARNENEIHVYELREAEAVLYSEAGEPAGRVYGKAEGGKWVFRSEGKARYRIVPHNADPEIIIY
jgi:alpha-D-xyloside xylohydrolase